MDARSMRACTHTARLTMATLLLLGTPAAADRTEEKHHEYGTVGVMGNNIPWLCTLGPTGARAILKKRAFLVREVNPGTPAAGKLKIDDLVIGANGKEFSQYYFLRKEAPSDEFKGYEGPMMDLGGAIEDSEGKDGRLVLKVKRGGQTLDVTIQIEPIGRFSDTWPFNCRKSEILLKKAIAFLKKQGDGRAHMRAWKGLCMMATDNMDEAKRIARSFGTNIGSGAWTWGVAHQCFYLCEYYLMTGDEGVFPAIEAAVKHLIHSQDKEKRIGGWGHAPQPQGYLSMSFTTHFALIGLCLAERIEGLNVDRAVLRKTIEKGFAAGKMTTCSNGAVGYGAGYGDFSGKRGWGSPGRTGVMMAARYMDLENDPETHVRYVKLGARYLVAPEAVRNAADGHGDGAMGSLWTIMGAIISKDPQVLRKTIEYNKAWFNLARTPDGGYQTLIGRDAKDHGYWKSGRCTAAMVMLYTLPNARLKLQGADLYIPGISKAKLNPDLKAAFKAIEERKYNAAEAKIRPHLGSGPSVKDAKDAKLLMDYVKRFVDEELARLGKIAAAGDVCALRERLAESSARFGGIPAYEERRTGWEAAFAKDPWKTELKAGKAYRRLVAGRSRAYRWSTYLGKLDAFAKKYPGSYYAKAAAKEAESINAMAKSTLADFEKLKRWGDLYTLSERLKDSSRKFAGIAAFDGPAAGYKKLVTSTENRQVVSRGREYYKVFTDAARIRGMIARMAEQKKPYPEATIKRSFAPLARRLESFAKRNPDSVYGKAAQEALTHYEQGDKTDVREVYFSGKPRRDARDEFIDGVKKRELDGM
ncbi:MAG: DUF6288 domain-containing protein [Planctomycetota bacterium]